MSYDINLCCPVSGEVLTLKYKHGMTGGTYAVGGTNELHLNITYNYSEHFYRVIDPDKGIRFIYGKTGAESIPILEKAIGKLGDDVVDVDYWKPTEGNAKAALIMLLTMAQLRPDGVWDGD